MIEIIAVILLCSVNSKNAKARGKSGGAAVGYTLGLWFGGEILGAAIGVAASGGEATPALYIIALLFAAGGGVGSYFIAKAGTVVAQNQAFPPPTAQQGATYSVQQPQPAYAGQQVQPTFSGQQVQPAPPQPGQLVQPAPPQPGQQVQPAPPHLSQQVQPAPPHPGQQPQTQPTQAQEQPQTATIIFSAKKVMGQFLVSTVTIEVNGVPYQTDFKQPINILAPAGNVQIDCYLNYMGKSGVAQMQATLAPNRSYQIEYKSPMVVTGSGTLNIMQI